MNKMMTKDVFRDILRRAATERIEADTVDTEPHEFSEGFEKRMEELINGGAKKNKARSKRLRRALIVAAAAIALLTAAACAVPQIRQSIAGFFVKVFDDHVEYIEPIITKDSIEDVYGLVPIPDGFEEGECVVYDFVCSTKFLGAEGRFITLMQSAKNGHIIAIDSEHGTFSEVTVNGIAVRIFLSPAGAVASWIQDGYYFSLSYSAPVEQELLEQWIASVDKL